MAHFFVVFCGFIFSKEDDKDWQLDALSSLVFAALSFQRGTSARLVRGKIRERIAALLDRVL